VEASGDPNVLYETRAAKRWLLWSHPSCRLRLTRDQLIFEDPEDKAYTFTLSMDELRRARFESPRGFFSTDDDLLIILEDGTEYEIGLDEGVKTEVLKMLKAILARYD
jgi:hypothetical protein